LTPEDLNTGIDGDLSQPMPVNGGRSSAGTDAQTQMDEVVLDTEDHMDLYTNIEIKEANVEAYKRYTKAVAAIQKKVYVDMGLKDGKDHALRILDKRIQIVGATGEVRVMNITRQPITKMHITTVPSD